MLLRILCVLLIYVYGGQSAMVRAAPPQDWEVMGIFFPADQQRQVVPRFYMPIELEDLDTKLAQESQRRQEAMLNTPTLAEAIYIARLDGELLSSDQSVWRFARIPQPQTFRLGRVSIALRDAYGLSSEREQLLDRLRFDSQGALELDVSDMNSECWFGFQVSAQRDSDGKLFELRLPAATVGKMLVQTPQHVGLSSPDVAVEPIEDYTTQIPSSWPAGRENTRPLGPSSRWWLVSLSGKSSFRLSVATVQSADSSAYKHTLRSALIEYLVDDEHATATCKFELANGTVSNPLRIGMSTLFHIRSILVDGIPTQWRSLPAQVEGSNLVEIGDAEIGPTASIEVIANCDLPENQSVRLPELMLAEAYAISGATTIRAVDGRRIDNLQSEQVSFDVKPLVAAGAENAALNDGLTWTAQWLGVPPQISATFSSLQTRWRASSLTRYTVYSASLTAATRLRLSSDSLASNEVRLKLDRAWFVDSIKLVGGNNDFRAQLVEQGDDSNRFTEIVVNWDNVLEAVSIELDIMAHSPREKDADLIQLTMARLVTLANAAQQDTFVIESSSRYQVQLNQSLLRYQKQPRELLDWQQALLPKSNDVWILQSSYDSIPPVSLMASGGTFASNSSTMIRQELDQLKIDYVITCMPVSGVIDRLRLLLPAAMDPRELQFALHQSIMENPLPLAFEIKELSENAVEREIEILLPTPTSTPWELHATLTRPLATDELQLFLLGVPGSVQAESVVILPKSWARFRGQPALELLPAQACCSDAQLANMTQLSDQSSPTSFVAARVDASESSTLSLQPADKFVSRGWVWSEHVEYRMWDDGALNYRVAWDLEVGALSRLNVSLPADWKLERILRNGEVISRPALVADNEIQIDISPNQRSQLILECTRIGKGNYWLEPILKHTAYCPSGNQLTHLGCQAACSGASTNGSP